MLKRVIEAWGFAEIVKACQGTSNRHDIIVSSVSTDTRTLEPGALFVALRGEAFDGHDYLDVAKENGAVAAVVSREVSTNLPTIDVEDTLAALQRLAQLVFLRANIPTIAITGSNGKTTTKELIRAVAGEKCFATPGNFNNHIGLPLTILATPVGTELLVLEMGANAFGDIKALVAIAPAQVRVCTSVGAAHLEGFGSIEGVYQAKAEILETIEGEVGVLSRELYEQFEERGLAPGDAHLVQCVDGFSDEQKAVARSENYLTYERRPDGVSWIFHDGRDGLFANPLAGSHNDLNLALALAAVRSIAELDSQIEIQSRLDQLVLPDGRSRMLQIGGHDVYDDAYNSNPSSLIASLRAWLEITNDGAEVPNVVVVGDMFELGERAEAHHREVAETIGTFDIDSLAFVGQFADVMAESSGHPDAQAFSRVENASDWLKKKSPSRVFLKASRGMKLERILHGLEE